MLPVGGGVLAGKLLATLDGKEVSGQIDQRTEEMSWELNYDTSAEISFIPEQGRVYVARATMNTSPETAYPLLPLVYQGEQVSAPICEWTRNSKLLDPTYSWGVAIAFSALSHTVGHTGEV